MREILNLLKGSDTPEDDIAAFMRANILFWMLGATDGHAKNFSIFLGPGGRYRMTPLYDVLTAQPSIDDGQIQRKKFKLAMSVGKNKHYAMSDVMPRHFLQTGDFAGVGEPVVRGIFERLASETEARIDNVTRALPRDFPERLVSSVTDALRYRARLLVEAPPEITIS